MKKHLKPYDKTNSEDPWLMEKHSAELICDPKTNQPLTAEYIWQHQGKERDALVERVFELYRSRTFEDVFCPPFDLGDEKWEQLCDEFDRLVRADGTKCVKEIVDENGDVQKAIKNSSSVGTNILKAYCGDLFYASKGSSKNARSCWDVFHDDELLCEVLRNRMGYRLTKEAKNGVRKERPYVFSMSDKMLIQGMRSSGLASIISTFKPAVAKYMYSTIPRLVDPNMAQKRPLKVFDSSCGWGARLLGAFSLGYDYCGLDPLTGNRLNEMRANFGNGDNGRISKIVAARSELKSSYGFLYERNVNSQFDVVSSSPPYFDLEVYSADDSQSVVAYPKYQQWLEGFWRGTVQSVVENVIAPYGVFELVMIDAHKKYAMAEDMIRICEEEGLKQKAFFPFVTSKSHLSNKAKTGSVSKTNEGIFVFQLY